jgi:ankyrin repeat protein
MFKFDSRIRGAMTLGRILIMVLLNFLAGAGIGCARKPVDSTRLDADLLESARKGNTTAVQQFLQRGAHIEAKDQGGSTALALASDYGHADTVELLIKQGADPIVGGVNSDDALVDAARAANANKVELLLQRGAVLKERNEALFAVGESEPAFLEVSPEVPQQIPSPQERDYYGTVKFPGMDPVATASLLLEHGADIESRREDGSTPLIEAADHGGTHVVKLLLDRGANVDTKDNRGNTALIAAACGCAIIDMPDTFDSMKLLLEKGADVNAKNDEGGTALMFAAGWGRARIVQLLLDKGANIDIKNGDGNTALMVSALGGGYRTAEATKVLLAGGAKIEARNNDGATALILAASKNGYEGAAIVTLLLDKGANVDAKDKHQDTALALALKNRHAEVVSLLKRRSPGTRRSSSSAPQ